MKRMNDKIDVLFKNFKDFQEDLEEDFQEDLEEEDFDQEGLERVEGDGKMVPNSDDADPNDSDYYGRYKNNDRHKKNACSDALRQNHDHDDERSQSSRDTLNSLYSNPRNNMLNYQEINRRQVSKNNHSRYDRNEMQNDHEQDQGQNMYITPPPSSSNSLIIQNNDSILHDPSPNGNDLKLNDARKRNGIININTINLLEEELYNLTPPQSPSRKLSSVTITIPPLPPPSRMLANHYQQPIDLEYNAISPQSNTSDRNSWNPYPHQNSNSNDDCFRSWLDRPTKENIQSMSYSKTLTDSFGSGDRTSVSSVLNNNSMDPFSSSALSRDKSPFGKYESTSRSLISPDESYMPNVNDPVDYDLIPKTELLKRAAGGALKAGTRKLQNLLNSTNYSRRISASNSYSYHERRSIDSTVPSLFDSGRRGSNASTASNTSTIQLFKRGSSNMRRTSSNQSLPFSNRTLTHKGTLSPLGIILEEENESVSLKRALSWPRRKPVSSILPPSVADATLLSGYESSNEVVDSAIFSLYLLKKNRRGQFQKRLVRCDGTLLVCMSSLSAYIRKGTISEYDLLESPHETIKKDLYNAIRDYYPPGSSISSLARILISVGKNGTVPDPNSKIYHVPKWIIPVSKITKFQCKQTVTGIPAAKLFTIHSSSSDTHTFQAYNLWEVGIFKELIVSMVDQLPEQAANPLYSESRLSGIMSDSVQVSVTQKMSMILYMEYQSVWKKITGELIRREENVGPKVTTIQVDENGAKVFRGLVMQPTPRSLINVVGEEGTGNELDFGEHGGDMDVHNNLMDVNGAHRSSIGRFKRNEVRKGRIFESSRFSQDISSKINEIDREIEKYQNKS